MNKQVPTCLNEKLYFPDKLGNIVYSEENVNFKGELDFD